jgi:hypothetical protein
MLSSPETPNDRAGFVNGVTLQQIEKLFVTLLKKWPGAIDVIEIEVWCPTVRSQFGIQIRSVQGRGIIG